MHNLKMLKLIYGTEEKYQLINQLMFRIREKNFSPILNIGGR